MAKQAIQASTTNETDEFEALFKAAAYLAYQPPLKSGGFLDLGDMSEAEWEAAENTLLALGGRPARRLQDRMAALELEGDVATVAAIQTLAVACDEAATKMAARLSAKSYRAYARAWQAWRQATCAALCDGRLRSPALEVRG